MRQVLFLSSIISFSSCAGFLGNDRDSQWAELESANKVNCAPWPLKDDDMRIEDLSLLQHNSSIGFISKVRKRNGAYALNYVPFKGDISISEDELKEMNVGELGIPAIGNYVKGDELFGVVSQEEGNGAQFQIRNINSNVVDSSIKIADEEITKAKLYRTTEGLWIVSEQENMKINYFPYESKLNSMISFPLKFDEEPKLVFNSASKTMSVLKVIKGDSPSFTIQELETNGKASSEKKLDLKIVDGIESWAISPVEDGYLIAYVSGDSVVGSATFNVAKFSGNSTTPLWVKNSSLNNMHVSEPIWVNSHNGKNNYSLILKWLDGESTIAAYNVETDKIGEIKNIGVYKKGSALIDAFSFGEDNDIYAVLRNRSGRNWEFQICELTN